VSGVRYRVSAKNETAKPKLDIRNSARFSAFPFCLCTLPCSCRLQHGMITQHMERDTRFGFSARMAVPPPQRDTLPQFGYRRFRVRE
jgi:hypothetical protein